MTRTDLILICIGLFCLLTNPVLAAVNILGPGGKVFIGEQGLDISDAMPAGYHEIAWYASGTTPSTGTPSVVQTIENMTNFYVSPSIYMGYTGPWFAWNGTAGPVVLNIQVPSVDLSVLDQNAELDVTNVVMPGGDYANFWIDTNLASIATRPEYNPSTDGVFTITVTSPTGITYTSLVGANGVQHNLTHLNVNTEPWYWFPSGQLDGWDTGAQKDGTLVYPGGTYTITTEYNANHLQDNIQGIKGIPSVPSITVILKFVGVSVTTTASTTPTTVYTPSLTTTAPTSPSTTVPTTVPPTTTTPGFEIIGSIAGIVAVVLLIRKRS